MSVKTIYVSRPKKIGYIYKMWIVVIVFLLIAILFISVSITQYLGEKMIFEPVRGYFIDVPVENTEDHYFDSSGKKVHSAEHASVIHSKVYRCKQSDELILYLHGSMGNYSFYGHFFVFCKIFEINLMIPDYRGFGQSKGILSGKSISEDSVACIRYAVEVLGFPKEKIIIWGESLGGSGAVRAATIYGPKAVVLLNTFSSLSDIVGFSESHNEWFKFFARISIQGFATGISTSNIIHRISDKTRIIIIHSTEDKLISYKCAEKNFSHISHDNKYIIPIKGDHALPLPTNDDIKQIIKLLGIREPTNDDIERVLDSMKQFSRNVAKYDSDIGRSDKRTMRQYLSDSF